MSGGRTASGASHRQRRSWAITCGSSDSSLRCMIGWSIVTKHTEQQERNTVSVQQDMEMFGWKHRNWCCLSNGIEKPFKPFQVFFLILFIYIFIYIYRNGWNGFDDFNGFLYTKHLAPPSLPLGEGAEPLWRGGRGTFSALLAVASPSSVFALTVKSTFPRGKAYLPLRRSRALLRPPKPIVFCAALCYNKS